ncbi:MAG TPA: glycosyltransferase, partial [Usitatibacter sp.]|nr:glycosyltransferase [Usitatibacter sp.]
VLFIISDLGFHGAQKQVVELSRGLAAGGHAVAIYTLNDDVPRAGELEGSGVELVVDQKRCRLDPAVLRRLRAKIVRWRPDIVHGFLFDGDIYARIAAIGTGTPVLNSERSDNYSISRVQKLAHWLTRPFVDGVVANSHSGSRFAQRLYGYSPAQMHVVWNGMRIDELEKRGASDRDYRREFFGEGGHKVACLVGSIKPAKDYPLALDTAKELLRLDPAWRVLFIGDQLAKKVNYGVGRDSDSGDYKAMVMAHYERIGRDVRIRFAGERADAPAIVKQCDVLFMTSRWEGFPNVVLEAMVLGVPVASTEYSDIRHILPRPEQVVASRSPQELARAIAAAHAHRAAIVEEQKRWVRAHAGIETVTRELERVYSRYVRAGACAQAV